MNLWVGSFELSVRPFTSCGHPTPFRLLVTGFFFWFCASTGGRESKVPGLRHCGLDVLESLQTLHSIPAMLLGDTVSQGRTSEGEGLGGNGMRPGAGD